jgi:hypothetical protein
MMGKGMMELGELLHDRRAVTFPYVVGGVEREIGVTYNPGALSDDLLEGLRAGSEEDVRAAAVKVLAEADPDEDAESLADRVLAAMNAARRGTRALAEALAILMLEWELASKGVALPIKPETMAGLPLGFRGALLTAIMDDMSPNAQKGRGRSGTSSPKRRGSFGGGS